jgi:CubicO group peptidase (beta-lactamase class C family)
VNIQSYQNKAMTSIPLPPRAFIGAAALVFTAATLPAQQPPDATRAAVNRVFAKWSSQDGPGCAVGASQNGKTVYEAGYGAANLEDGVPITPASIFHAASVSKQFTATAVMLLVREGKLSLDADVRTYLPELPDYGHRITVRHLLTHTSGIRDQWDLLAIARGRFEENRITEADVLDIVTRQKALNFVPGTEYLYSNSGYTLAAIIVGRVAGKPLRQFADERIFKPLGMARTHFHDDYTMIVKGRTSAYEPRRDGQWRVSIPNFDTYGATSLFTTVGDLLKWQENFEHPVVGDAAMLREMQTSAVLANGDTTGYGLGLQMSGPVGARIVGHSGADAGYRAYTGRYPERRFAIAVLCNAGPSDPASLARNTTAVFLTDLPKAPPVPVAANKPTAGELQQLAGLFVHPVTGDVTYVSVKGADLIVGQTDGPTLVPVAPRRFRLGTGATEWEFAPNGDLIQRFTGSPPRHSVTLARKVAARPTPAQLATYAGNYRSEELGATYSVAARDTALSFRTGVTDALMLRPAYGDTFDGDVMAEFTRDSAGRVNGVLVSTGRVRRVRFEKTR